MALMSLVSFSLPPAMERANVSTTIRTGLPTCFSICAISSRTWLVSRSCTGTGRTRTCQLEERLTAGAAWRDEDLVFCTPIGGAVCGNHLSERDFRALLARANLPRIRFHDLRHTCATLLLRRG